jgi:hypothetical protein
MSAPRRNWDPAKLDALVERLAARYFETRALFEAGQVPEGEADGAGFIWLELEQCHDGPRVAPPPATISGPLFDERPA